MDLISRQAAIDAYGEWYVEEGTAEGFIGTVGSLLETLPSAQQWIPCSERLPDGDTDVLVSVHVRGVKHNTKKGCYWRIKPSYYVDIAQMIGGDWVCNMDEYLINRDRHKVVAWMLLPKPWEGGQDENGTD